MAKVSRVFRVWKGSHIRSANILNEWSEKDPEKQQLGIPRTSAALNLYLSLQRAYAKGTCRRVDLPKGSRTALDASLGNQREEYSI